MKVEMGVWRRGLVVIAASAALWAGVAARGQSGPAAPLQAKVAVVLPTQNNPTVRTLEDVAANAARNGSLMGIDDGARFLLAEGVEPVVLLANAPDAESARRAALRLIATENVLAIVGGVGEDQAEELRRVAQEHGVLFFNIGERSDKIRDACYRRTFHVEASSAMVLDAMAMEVTIAGLERLFVVHPGGDEGRRLLRRFEVGLRKVPRAPSVVGSAGIGSSQWSLSAEIDAVRDSGADSVVLLVDGPAQEAFMAQADWAHLDIATRLYRTSEGLGRYALASIRQASDRLDNLTLISTWDPTLDADTVGSLNGRYAARFGAPMDPAAWAAYQAVRILLESVAATGSVDADAVAMHMSAPGTTFDVGKGAPVGFRAWDHQLRQPLYVIRLDLNARWDAHVSQQLRVASVIGTFPSKEWTQDPSMLDLLGDEEPAGVCSS